MNTYYVINFGVISVLSLLLYQFPAKIGFSGPWFENLRFIKPLSFFVFLCLPLALLFFEVEQGTFYYRAFYGLTTLYFIVSSIREKRLGFNTVFAMIFMCLLTLNYYLYTLL